METKKEFTVADFINFAVIYEVLDHNLNIVLDDITGDNIQELKKDITEIYDLLVSAVTLKNGKKPEYWYYKLSALHIALSHKTANEIYDKFMAFKEKVKQNYHLYNEDEKVVIGDMADYRIEFAIESLSEAFADL